MRPSLTARNFINVKQCLSEKEVRMLAKVLAFERIINLCVDGRKHPRERLTSKSHKIMQCLILGLMRNVRQLQH